MLDQSELALNCEASNEFPKLGEIITCVCAEIIWELFCMLDQSELALNCEPSNECPKLGEIMLTCALELLVPRTEIKTHMIKHSDSHLVRR